MGTGPIAGIDCRWIIHGLVPGTYQVDLIQPEGSAGSSEPFAVRPNEIARVVIGRPTSRISGRISANGAPLAGVSLEIGPKDRRWGTTSVTTDANGRYAAFLARAGEYEMRLSGKSAPTTYKFVDVAAGSNTVDWALAERGSVSVRVRGIRAGLPTTVRIEARQATHTGELKSGDEPVLTKVGLGFETYSVSATQGDALVSPITNVQLDASHPEATVDVELAENRSSLVLSDPSGNAVRDARVRAVSPPQLFARGNWSLPSKEPGVYSLDGLRPGMYLQIRAAGMAPACRTVPLNGTTYATLEAGRHVDVQLPHDLSPAVVRELAALFDVPGSDCPVPLADFEPRVRQPSGVNQPLSFEFAHFPSASRLGLLRFPLPPRQILVPEVGSVIVERD